MPVRESNKQLGYSFTDFDGSTAMCRIQSTDTLYRIKETVDRGLVLGSKYIV